MSYARRQQVRRLRRAGAAAFGSGIAVLLASLSASGDAFEFAVLLLTSLGLGFCARHWLSLAHRSGIGIRSEDEVRRALASMEGEGWRVRRSLGWGGPGDMDFVAIAPTGIAVVIEVKTRTYEEHHLARQGADRLDGPPVPAVVPQRRARGSMSRTRAGGSAPRAWGARGLARSADPGSASGGQRWLRARRISIVGEGRGWKAFVVSRRTLGSLIPGRIGGPHARSQETHVPQDERPLLDAHPAAALPRDAARGGAADCPHR